MGDPKFKPCMQHQGMLLPPNLSDLIPEGAMVRVVDSIVDGMDASRLRALYPGGGAPAHDPSMMLKVVLLAYASGIYSSRKIARATAENINFMWLCGMRPLDHNTVNRFRSERIRPVFEDVFSEIISVLAEAGHVTLDTYFLDGTKVEANANKFTFVWKKSTDKYQEALRRKVHAHLAAIDELNDEEEALAPEEPAQVDSGAIEEAARKINERLAAKECGGEGKDEEAKSLRKAARAIEGDYLPRMQKYETQQKTFGGRNSFSKTDADATFMRMKDDAMGNGQLKAGYNVQAGTENQFIVDVTVHQRPGDTACLKPHVESFKESFGHVPSTFVADAGYGSEENYDYLEGEGAEAFVKYNTFHKEQKKSFAQDPAQPANWEFDADSDEYRCGGGRALAFECEREDVSELGYESTVRIYGCPDCSGCPLAAKCLKAGQKNRRNYVNPHRDALRKKAAERLTSDEGVVLRKRRSTDVETVFGDVKRNWGFRRFTLRGIEKVAHEWRLLMMGHNIRKLARKTTGADANPAPAAAIA